MSTTLDEPIRILLVDDDEDDYVLTRDLLAEIPESRFQLDWTADDRRALDLMCRGDHDLYLVDYRLGRTTGLELIREANERRCNGPIILLTGLGERALDYAAMQAGAFDYLEKGKLDSALLERSIRYTLQQKHLADELERKVSERTAALARANDALREADRRKDLFLATLAHELRNPLVPIRNALEIMRLADDRPELLANCRSMIERQVTQLVRLVDDLLDISRISHGKIQLRIERIDLSDVVANAVEGCRPLIEKAGHTLSIEMPAAPIRLEADPTRLAQVLLNLLNNAAKYTDPGGRIEFGARIDGSDVVLRVKDNGVGIPADLLPHVFEMFNQVHDAHEQTQSGLGIGLSLVRGLVELHDGSIRADSAGPGKGSEFVVRLPLISRTEGRGPDRKSSPERAEDVRPQGLRCSDRNGPETEAAG